MVRKISGLHPRKELDIGPFYISDDFTYIKKTRSSNFAGLFVLENTATKL